MIPGDVRDRCFWCGREGLTELHHIYGGPCRKKSDELGLTVHLCPTCHRGTRGVHGKDGKQMKLWLHQIGQQFYEAFKEHEGMTPEEARDAFRKDFIRSYL